MITENHSIIILDRYADVAPFVSAVNQASDSDKHALGFLPSSMFEDFARKEKLFVAVERNDEGLFSYAGHLLFEAGHPKGRVLQMFVAPASRKQRVAARLLSHLKQLLTDHAFISIYARVAEDLVQANRFWENQGFYIQSITRGGETKNRTILVRSHELDTPQLFAPSVLDSAGLEAIGQSNVKTVAAFDNIICLDRPVPRSTLLRLGCGSPNNLLTTRAIDNTQLQGILEEGFAHGTSRTRTHLA